LAVVGNKSDLYEYEEVTEEEGLAFAKEINAIFKTVSAKTGAGINDLFYTIGKQFLQKLGYPKKKQIQQTKKYPKKENNFDKKLKKYLDY